MISAGALDKELREYADPQRAAKEKQYLHSDLVHYGVAVPTLHQIAARAAREVDHDSLFGLTAELWDEPVAGRVFERRFLAADVLASRPDLVTPAELPLIERMLREARTWAIVDTLAPRVVGPLAERFPDALTPVLDNWVDDPDFWVRRSCLLAHLVPLRSGRGDWARFTRYAEALLGDREFFVAKALGWVLRDTGRRRPDMVLGWVEPRFADMATVTAREAVKPFGAHVQERLRESRQAARSTDEPGSRSRQR
jgi:3-methyladenine DNA glycosylase AlkD